MFEKIIAAIDSDPKRSTKVVEAARELARSRMAEVLVTHVREVERPAAMLAKAGAVPPSLHVDAGDPRDQVERAVAHLRSEGVDARGEVANGVSSTANELIGTAVAWGANVIVVGDRDAKVSDLIQGGVAHRIVHMAGCPVLVVR